MLKKGDTFIDLGAHVGLYTIIASKKVGEEGNVISIEPNPENCYYLKKNCEGFDLMILKGAKATLKKTRYLIIEEHSEDIILFLKKHGFKVKIVMPSNYIFAINSKKISI